MNRIIYTLCTLIALTSCANSYDIQGSSNLPMLDGRMLYLKIYHDNDLRNVDSCDVVHGQFCFKGVVDSVMMATLFMDDESIMPVVIESGNISIKIDNTQQKVNGTPLNDKLTQFMEQYNRLSNRFNELDHKQSQAIMDGEDEEETNRRLNQEAAKIMQEEDRLVTTFITENFDNVLGPGIFFMLTASYRYPELQPWIEDLLSKATDNFKNNAYVKEYVEKAKQIEAIQNGTADQPMQQQPLPQAPTPNQMAAPADSVQ
ncbi:MAG: DUF4369 domain-containing protein [Prevotellaceae bacterium]|nr:DUF4369 domain-containing protein [Prevotella sp.]MDD7256902.1 DUF4369 domain-containing protein [Prevotellaceae bacterium]MDY6129748.1 DUF4369 domain-containing protein [Prevotella sp.]